METFDRAMMVDAICQSAVRVLRANGERVTPELLLLILPAVVETLSVNNIGEDDQFVLNSLQRYERLTDPARKNPR